MKLVDILARELNEWPKAFGDVLGQRCDGTLHGYNDAGFVTWIGETPQLTRCDNYMHNIVTRAQWQEARDALNKPAVEAWDGEGLPPIGTEFEFTTNAGYNWHRGSILFMDPQVVLLNGYQLFKVKDPDLAFRPILTPEQIAEQEMIVGLNEMIGHMKDHPSGTHGVSHLKELMIHEDVARDLWAAGYRKQEPKPE